MALSQQATARFSTQMHALRCTSQRIMVRTLGTFWAMTREVGHTNRTVWKGCFNNHSQIKSSSSRKNNLGRFPDQIFRNSMARLVPVGSVRQCPMSNNLMVNLQPTRFNALQTFLNKALVKGVASRSFSRPVSTNHTHRGLCLQSTLTCTTSTTSPSHQTRVSRLGSKRRTGTRMAIWKSISTQTTKSHLIVLCLGSTIQ
mmetsp:Transcript_41025/g.57135  ORF Transcript_41025/g.57135 Transcript_41025/m.57135 type:complete len:200 (-) Transcript_41025:702-1301(-)